MNERYIVMAVVGGAIYKSYSMLEDVARKCAEGFRMAAPNAVLTVMTVSGEVLLSNEQIA